MEFNVSKKVKLEGSDAVFYRTYPLLYHKFKNMVIFRPGNSYSLCSPGNQDYQKIINFKFSHQKRSKSNGISGNY